MNRPRRKARPWRTHRPSGVVVYREKTGGPHRTLWCVSISSGYLSAVSVRRHVAKRVFVDMPHRIRHRWLVMRNGITNDGHTTLAAALDAAEREVLAEWSERALARDVSAVDDLARWLGRAAMEKANAKGSLMSHLLRAAGK